VADNTLSEALLVLRKRRWVLIIAAMFGLALGIYNAISQPVIFTATGRIEVRSGSSNQYRLEGGAVGSLLNNDTHLQTEVAILQSETLMMSVAREMDLANNPDFTGARYPQRRNLDDPDIRQKIVHALQGTVRVSQIPRTDIISIAYQAGRPQLAADIVNHIINSYIQRSYETRFASTQRVSQWLSSQLDDLKHQVETSQEQLIDLQKRLGVIGLGLGGGLEQSRTESTSALDALSRAASDAKVARIIAESRFRVLNGADPNTMEGYIDNVPGTAPQELSRLRSELAVTRAGLAEMAVKLGPNHPTYRASKAHVDELQKEIDTEQGRLLTQAHQAYIAARANEDQTAGALDQQKNEAYRLRDDLVEYTLRQREYESNRTLYEGLLSRLRAAGVQAGLESLEIDIVDKAQTPAQQTLKPRTGIIMTSTIFSLLAGIVLAFLLESLDTGVRSVAEIESITQLPSLAVIPRVRKVVGDASQTQSVAQRNIGVLTTSKSQFAEAFRSLRTSLMLATTGHPPKILHITSATPAEGKTTIATNLACILAQRETRVLLIDADLRRPSVHHRFGLNGKVGLSTVLVGATSFEEALQHIPEVPNLDILAGGPVPPFPTEILSSEAMHALLEKCVGIYTHIVIDTPPILSVTDGIILAQQADAVVLIVRHGKSSRHVVRRARDLLFRSGAPITGVVLNAVDLNSPEYYGYYGYSGYAYSNLDSSTWDVESGKQKNEEERGA
jgi:capsular exopolysaccharide synthesis family protein